MVRRGVAGYRRVTGLNLDQRRAAHALARIRRQQKHPRQSDYLSYAKALPGSILQNGLGQAMATLLAAARSNEHDPHFLLYRDLEDWLCGDDEDAPYRGAQGLLEATTTKDQRHYLRAQAEAQGYLNWLKKLAAAHLDAESRDDGDG